MSESKQIVSWCRIKNNKIVLNEETVYTNEGVLDDFLKAAYKNQETKYPKFFKMDRLSKLAFLAADILLKSQRVRAEQEEDIALVFANKASSLDTDRKHQESIQDRTEYYPSPAVFVYTLPNICLGEISIKYKLYSENSFFIFERFNADRLYTYTTDLLVNNKAAKVLCGWVDVDEGEYEAFVYLVADKGNVAHTINEIETLYIK